MAASKATPNCEVCDKEDNDEMVQCDSCDKWFHFSCVNVDRDIANKDWKCEKCEMFRQASNETPLTTKQRKPQRAHSATGRHTEDMQSVVENQVRKEQIELSKCGSSRHAKKLALERLEEERKMNIEFIKKKFEIMLQYDSSGQSDDDEEVDFERRKRTEEWARQGATESKKAARMWAESEGGGGEEKQTRKPEGNKNNNEIPCLSTAQINARQIVSTELPTFTGKALDYVGSRLLIPALVPEIISTLRMVFGRPEQIVNSLLVKIRASPHVNANKLETLINFALEVKNVTATMEASGLNNYLANPSLIQELVQKLPAQVRLEWAMCVHDVNAQNLTSFSNWLYKRAEAASSVVGYPGGNEDVEKRKAHRVNFHEKNDTSNKAKTGSTCGVCQQAHETTRCQRFLQADYNTKWKMVNDNGLCRTCLKSHDKRFCPERKECGINGCTAKHNPALHKRERQEDANNGLVVAAHLGHTSKVLYKIVPVTIHAANASVDIFALLDDGSGPTLIAKEVTKKLMVNGRQSDLVLRWTDGSIRVEKGSEEVQLKISARGKAERKYQLRDVRTVSALNLPAQTMSIEELSARYRHLRGLPIDSYYNGVPLMIIGMNNINVATPLKFREGKLHEPAAAKTRLGWVVFGTLNHANLNDTQSSYIDSNLQLHICVCDNDIALDKLVIEDMALEKSNWEIKSIECAAFNPDDYSELNKIVARDDSKYEARLLWKSDEIKLPNNYKNAFYRLVNFEKKLSKDKPLREQVNTIISEMQSKNYIRKLNTNELESGNPRQWYLPIFVVRNPNKPQKIRVVWDAAAECNGSSLNKCLEKGPDLLTPLIKVLFNFRIGKIAISGDIQEMYHRIAVNDEDQHSQRFMWRDGDTSRPPDHYVLQVLSFGATCSPSIAQFVKNKNAFDCKEEFPRATKSILERHYVDDMLDSTNTVEEAIQLAMDVRETHKRANFHIRNWLSNSTEVIKALGEAGLEGDFCHAGTVVEQVIEADKVLGLWWQTSTDTLTFNLKYTKASKDVLEGKRLPTKRELLRLIMSIFDPLGFLNFYTIYIKVLLQRTWRSGIGWDDTIPEEIANEWKSWLSLLDRIHEVKLSRCYFQKTNSDAYKTELHIFTDASENAYAAVAYLRILDQGVIEVSFVCSRAKVAPLRPIAAVMGARLADSVKRSHDLSIASTHFWTDSRTVLLWLQSDPRQYKQFVAFRLGKIQELTNIQDWNHVPTKKNVADLATKWSRRPSFAPTDEWFAGPKFLYEELISLETHNCLRPDASHTELRNNLNMHHEVVSPSQPYLAVDLSRFRKWERLFRSVAYVKKFITNVRTNISRKKGQVEASNMPPVTSNLTSEEMQWSEKYLYRIAQSDAFKNEISLLLQNPNYTLPKASALRKRSPYLDADEVVRLRGRIDRTTLVDNFTKNPVILPKGHIITRLIVEFYHRKYNHANHETVINELFRKYYISGLRTLLRNIRHNCQRCKNANAVPNPPQMGSLPPARMSAFHRPFSYVGVDFFGPFLVTIARRSEKRYGAVFTCLTCRAVHIEVAFSLNTTSCIIVIRNFIARRGVPLRFYSDNGTNLKAAEKELREAHQNIDFREIQAKFTTPETQWTFIPPASPHMGGAWERMVRSIKSALYHVITPNTRLTDEKLHNLLLEVESIVNNRPLTYLSLDTAEQEALTPNHFLLGSSSSDKPPGVFNKSDQFVKMSWRHSQMLADQFWKRWVAEVLPELTRRSKWFERRPPIQTGDVVLIADPNSPRHSWPKGVVTSTFPGKDNQVRSVMVRTATGEYHRPATKIAVLDVQKMTTGDVQGELVVPIMDRD